ncbi:MAG: TRAP transporter substrate-binding protein DctP [Lacrimispora sp.]
MKKVIGCIGLCAVLAAGCISLVLMKNGFRFSALKDMGGTTPEFVFTYAENQPEGYPTTMGAERFAQLVGERTHGRIRINVFSGGKLGDEVSVMDQLQFGGVDFARVSVMTMGEVAPEVKRTSAALSLPGWGPYVEDAGRGDRPGIYGILKRLWGRGAVLV